MKNKLLKKIVSGLLVVSMVSVLAGCSGGSTSDSKDDSTTEAAEELNIYLCDMSEDEGLAMAEMFEKDTGIKLNVYAYSSEDFVQSFMVAANGNQDIDLLELNGQDVRSFVMKGLLQDVSGLECVDRLDDAAVEQYTYGDKLYGIGAFSGKSSGIYVNMDLIEEYGAKAPETMDDLLDLRDKLKADGKSVFGFGGGSVYMWPMWYFSTFAQTSGGKPVERTEEILTGKAKFTDADSIEAFQVLRTFAEEGFWQEGFNGTDSDGGLAVFTGGNAACFYGGTWDTRPIEKSGMENVELMKFPIIKDGATSLQPGDVCDTGWSIYSKIDPSRQAAAEKFLDWVTSEETLQNFRDSDDEGLREWGLNDVNKNLPDPEEITPLDQTKNEFRETCTFTLLDWIYPPEITTELQTVLQSLTGLQITAEQAGEQMQAVMDQLLADGYDFNAAQ